LSGKYKLKRCLKKECCKQCRHVRFKGTMTIWPAHKQTHRTTQKHIDHQYAIDIDKKLFLCFSDFSFFLLFCIYNFLNFSSNTCSVTTLTFIWVNLNQFLFKANKPHTFWTFFWRRKRTNVHLHSLTRPFRKWTKRLESVEIEKKYNSK